MSLLIIDLPEIFEMIVKNPTDDELKQESCLHSAVMALCRIALLTEKLAASLHHKFIDIVAQIMVRRRKSSSFLDDY